MHDARSIRKSGKELILEAGMKKLQVLCPGCTKCNQITANPEAAARELNLDCDVEKVTAINEITKFGVMLTPALVIDG